MPRLIKNNILYTSGNDFIEMVQTLPANTTSLVFENPIIDNNSVIELFSTVYGVAPKSILRGAGRLTLTFDEQPQNIDVKVRISF